MAPDVEASSVEIQSQEETVEGGLVFTCTEEDDYGEEEEEESDVTGESNVGNSSGHSSPETNSRPEKLGGCDKRSIVNYPDSDEGEEQDQRQGQSPMEVDNAVTPVVCSGEDGKRNNTMLFLKSKRIERHNTRRIDSTPIKKMRTGQSQANDR
jgi:hypothetical protein